MSAIALAPATCAPEAGPLPAPDGNPGAPYAIVAIAAIFLFYHETFWSMIALWSRSQTFAHGFLIVPVSAWLVWRQRRQLARMPQRPCMPALLLLAALGALWLAASVANVPVLSDYAATAMIVVTAVAVLGWQAARSIAFPLAYLLLAVPFGEVFIPPLIDFTARFTVGALQLSGIPVFRENNFFSIPSGNWSVVDACSGLRYVIASLALGTLFAHLNYHSLRRRLLFIGVALVLPIFANGARAYLIVMIGHWSGMRLAVGVDHLIYGWVFFGFVSLLLFWAGAYWRDQAPVQVPAAALAPRATPGRFVAATTACIAIGAGWSLYAAALTHPAGAAALPAPLDFAAPAPWQESALPPQAWQAAHAGKPSRFARAYGNGRGDVTLQVAWYAHQVKEAELLTPADDVPGPYREIDSGPRTVSVGTRRLALRQAILQGPANRLLVWRWYRQGGVDTPRAAVIKLLLARSKILHLREDGAEIIVTAPFDGEMAPAEAQLGSFLSSMLAPIDEELNHAASR